MKSDIYLQNELFFKKNMGNVRFTNLRLFDIFNQIFLKYICRSFKFIPIVTLINVELLKNNFNHADEYGCI